MRNSPRCDTLEQSLDRDRKTVRIVSKMEKTTVVWKKKGDHMMKKLMSVFLAILLVLSLGLTTAFADEADAVKSEVVSEEETEIRELTEEELYVAIHVIENFVALSQVPRPTGHEEKVSAFFMQWAKEQGLNPVQDEVLNVIFDVPATKGYEDWPMVGLQSHMDMVCVGDSPDYDPENDPITVLVDYDNITMTADGTSLGGDDGIGCAIIMSMAEGLAPHGPLRVILTVDEEGFMTGIANLDPSVVEDLKYLVNVDSETSDAVTVSTAGGVEVDVTCDEVDRKAPEGDLAVTVTVSGLAGGHSGVDIDKGRQNAIYVLDSVLEEIANQGIFFEIASMEGGTASNAIPDNADAVLVIRSEELEKLSTTVQDQEAKWKERAGDADPNLSISAAKADGMPEAVVAPEFAERVHSLLNGLVNGIYSMSDEIEGLVESSSNMGVFSLSPEGLTSYSYARSSSSEKQEEILDIAKKVIAENGLTAEYVWGGDPWPYKPDSVLRPLTQEVYREQNGSEIKVEAVHATLECGTFSKMNPDLDMVSIGPDLINVHSTSEMLYLLTIPKTFNLLAGILDGVAEADAQRTESLAQAA